MANKENCVLDVEHIAKLARLGLSEEQKKRIGEQLENILEHFKALEKVDVTHVEPTAHAFPVYNVFGEDTPRETFSAQEALMNAPLTRDGQFVVPTIVE